MRKMYDSLIVIALPAFDRGQSAPAEAREKEI